MKMKKNSKNIKVLGKSNKISKLTIMDKPLNKIDLILIRYFNIISIILIILAGILVYSNSFDCPFYFDDFGNISDNQGIKNLSMFTNTNYWSQPRRQMAYISFALNYHFNKFDVFGYHLINILIHIMTGIFTFLLIKLILNLNNSKNIKFNKYKDWIALFSALFFVVHPLQTQAVTYIVQRMTSMAAMFYIISIYLYAIGRIEHTQKNNILKAIIFYSLAVIIGMMGVMTKENAVTFPFAMLLFEFFFIRNSKNKIYKNYIIIISLSVIVVGCISCLFLNSSLLTSAATSGINISSLEYLINQFIVIVRYLQLTILPFNQCADYGNVAYNFPFVTSIWRLDVIGCFLLLAGLIVLAVLMYKKNKILSFGIFWLFLTLSVESSIIPIADPMFEHRMYLPMLGIALFLFSSLFLLLIKIKTRYVFLLLSSIIIVMGIICFLRNDIWKNEKSLWSDVIKKAPYNSRAWYSLGLIYEEMGSYEEAIKYYSRAVILSPHYDEAWYNEGLSLFNIRKNEDAIKCFDEAIKINPGYHEAWYNKGLSFVNLNKNEDAIKCFDEAIKIKPDKIGAWNNKGNLLSSINRNEEAVICYNRVLEIKPDYQDAWNNKGSALTSLGMYDEALNCLNKALEINPDYQDAWNNKGIVLGYLGRSEDEIKCYDKAIELKPDYQDAINNRKIALEKINKRIKNRF
jgi:protein O-mannosyl-transferase